ncbi:MAG: hypothetical protein IJU54_00520, partial [Alphaproteobacteria bacterium]|nr:hypothetical protein [Alphaproteobacteria bacterium]
MFKLHNINDLINSNKELVKYLLIIFILAMANIILTNIKDNNELELIEINNKYNILKKLNEDKFISKHSFKEDKNNTNNFINYIKEYLKNNHGEVISIKNIENKNIESIKVKIIEFLLTFPHDKFIFELLERIQNYSPGFVRITDIYIEKDEKFDINKNN